MDPFQDFWTASRSTTLTQRRFVERLETYQPEPVLVDPLTLPGKPHPLARPKDGMQRLFDRRRSTREFDKAPLSARKLGMLLSALAGNGTSRSHPSAGGLHPLRCYPMLFNVRHALQDVGPCPPWPKVADAFGAESAPHVVPALVLADEPVLEKYGQRGGRFGPIEVGAAAQSLGLRPARHRLGGYLLGYAADDLVLDLLGLTGHQVRLGALMSWFEELIRPALRQDEWILITVGALLGFGVGEPRVLLVEALTRWPVLPARW